MFTKHANAAENTVKIVTNAASKIWRLQYNEAAIKDEDLKIHY